MSDFVLDLVRRGGGVEPVTVLRPAFAPETSFGPDVPATRSSPYVDLSPGHPNADQRPEESPPTRPSTLPSPHSKAPSPRAAAPPQDQPRVGHGSAATPPIVPTGATTPQVTPDRPADSETAPPIGVDATQALSSSRSDTTALPRPPHTSHPEPVPVSDDAPRRRITPIAAPSARPQPPTDDSTKEPPSPARLEPVARVQNVGGSVVRQIMEAQAAPTAPVAPSTKPAEAGPPAPAAPVGPSTKPAETGPPVPSGDLPRAVRAPARLRGDRMPVPVSVQPRSSASVDGPPTVTPLAERVFGLPAAVSSSRDTVQVHIGRIEVRAVMPPQPQPKDTARPRLTPPLSLAEYLKRRNGGAM